MENSTCLFISICHMEKPPVSPRLGACVPVTGLELMAFGPARGIAARVLHCEGTRSGSGCRDHG